MQAQHERPTFEFMRLPRNIAVSGRAQQATKYFQIACWPDQQGARHGEQLFWRDQIAHFLQHDLVNQRRKRR